jgi:hypothetical protein
VKKIIVLIILIISILSANIEYQSDGRNNVVIINLYDTLGNLGGKLIFATNGLKTTGVTTLQIEDKQIKIETNEMTKVFPMKKAKGSIYKFSSRSVMRDAIYLLMISEEVRIGDYSSDLENFTKIIKRVM